MSHVTKRLPITEAVREQARNMNEELRRALRRQQWLIDARQDVEPETHIKHTPGGPIEVVAQIQGAKREMVLRDMQGGPEGWTTVGLRDIGSTSASLEKAHLDDEHSVKAYLSFLYGQLA